MTTEHTIDVPDGRVPPAPGVRRVLVSVAPMYFGQDVLLTFLLLGLGTVLRTNGAGLNTLALLSATPFVIAARFLWAPLVDRFGRYVTWLGVSQLGVTACCVTMMFLDPVRDTAWVIALVAVAMLMSSVQETAASALTIRLVDVRHRGVANGLVVALVYIGILVGGTGFLLAYEHWSWSLAVLIVALPNLCAMLALPSLAKCERSVDRSALATAGVGLRTILTVFRDRAVRRWVLVAIPLYVFGYYVASALVSPMLVDAHYSPSQVGMLSGAGTIGGIAAALCGGFVATYLGRGKALTIFGLLRVVAVMALLPLAAGQQSILAICAVVLMGVAESAGASVQSTVVMDAARTSSPGSDAATQSAVAYVIRVAAAPLGLAVAGASGYGIVLVVAAVVATVGTLAALRYHPDPSEAR